MQIEKTIDWAVKTRNRVDKTMHCTDETTNYADKTIGNRVDRSWEYVERI